MNIFQFIKKHVGFKVAAISSLSMIVLTLSFLFIFSQLQLHLNPQNLFGIFGIFLFFFTVFQFVLTVLLINFFIQKPINKLQHCMQKVEDGNLQVDFHYETPDEFGEIALSFNQMVRGLNEMNETRKRMEQKLIKTEESLKYKIALEDKARIIERMNSELTDAFNNVALLYTVSQFLNSVHDMKELITTVQKIFEEKFICDQYALYFTGPVENELQLACCKGFRNSSRWDDYRITFGEGIAGKVALKNRSLYFEDSDVAFDSNMQLSDLEKRMKGSIISLPLTVRGSLIGVLTVTRHEKSSFSPTDRQSLQSIISQIAVAYDRVKLYSRTKELAIRDELTGIYNRRHFLQMLNLEIKRAERYERPLSLLMIDVDHFKNFNDTYGHLKGDEVLKELAQLLKKNLREVDILARYGGEEFVVMLTDTNMKDAISVASKLRELVQMNLIIDTPKAITSQGEALLKNITISVGVSSYPECSSSPEELLNSADMALYMAKHKGRNKVYAYQSGHLPLEELMSKRRIIH